MVSDGFRLTGFEGSIDQAGEFNRLPPPFELQGVRPDACGVHVDGSVIGFAEAKTERDVDTAHTRIQLRVFGYARMRDGKTPCPLYIAVPRSCTYALDRVLVDLGLIAAKHVRRIHVPEVLLARWS